MAHPNEPKKPVLVAMLAQFKVSADPANAAKIKALEVQIARITSEEAALADEKIRDAETNKRILAARARAKLENPLDTPARTPRNARKE